MPQDPVVRERNRRLAEQTRVDRGQLKRALKDGTVDRFDLLAGNAPEWEAIAKKMKLRALLVAIPGVGEVTADEMIAEAGVPVDVRVYGLTYQLRDQLATLLRGALLG